MNQEQELIAMAEGIQRREGSVGFEALPEKEKVFTLVWNLEAEVNNGGFHQFFLNSTGDYASETVEALRSIQALVTSKLLSSAIAVFGDVPLSQNWEVRQSQVLNLPEEACVALESLDQRFYEYTDDLSGLLFSYMQRP